jgi:mannose-6-phosphate isomerase-like protein (cupin superfamily)
VNEAVKVQYRDGSVMPSGMVIEEAITEPGTFSASWPFECSRFTVPPGATSEIDQHEVAEVWMVRSGTGTIQSLDASLDVSAGESVFFPPWIPHQVTNTGSRELEVFSVWWGEAGR